MSYLTVQGVSHFFADRVLNDVTFDVPEGGVLCLLGASGCGKSTLLKLIAGIERCNEGRITLNNRDITHVDAANRDVALVLQEPALFPHMTVLENVLFAAKDRKLALENLEKLGVKNLANRYPHQISGGQQQRVSIARALQRKPKLLLLDEPFANLDMMLKRRLREEMVELLKLINTTTVIVTHDPHDALSVASHVCVLEEGQVSQFGASADLYHNPKTEFIARFFNEPNVVETTLNNHKALTPFGKFTLSSQPKNAHVKLLIRPEDVKIVATGIVKANVEKVKFLGLTSIIYLRTVNSDVALRSQVFSDQLPQVGAKVAIKIDKLYAFALEQESA